MVGWKGKLKVAELVEMTDEISVGMMVGAMVVVMEE
jgi:hypothetical protein